MPDCGFLFFPLPNFLSNYLITKEHDFVRFGKIIQVVGGSQIFIELYERFQVKNKSSPLLHFDGQVFFEEFQNYLNAF